MTPLVAHNSRWRLAMMCLGCLAFVLIGLWMIDLLGETPSSTRYPTAYKVVIGWFGFIFFSLAGMVWATKIFSTKPQLRVDSSGITSPKWSGQLIPWSKISKVTIWNHNKQELGIVVHLLDPKLVSVRGLTGFMAKANRLIADGDFWVPLVGTNCTCHEAMAAVAYFRKTETAGTTELQVCRPDLG